MFYLTKMEANLITQSIYSKKNETTLSFDSAFSEVATLTRFSNFKLTFHVSPYFLPCYLALQNVYNFKIIHLLNIPLPLPDLEICEGRSGVNYIYFF
jgi:hypothetical protein